jgi:hypothetical protein
MNTTPKVPRNPDKDVDRMIENDIDYSIEQKHKGEDDAVASEETRDD